MPLYSLYIHSREAAATRIAGFIAEHDDDDEPLGYWVTRPLELTIFNSTAVVYNSRPVR